MTDVSATSARQGGSGTRVLMVLILSTVLCGVALGGYWLYSVWTAPDTASVVEGAPAQSPAQSGEPTGIPNPTLGE